MEKRDFYELKSNFINCSQKYMNKGKYMGYHLSKVPKWYLIWANENVLLNNTEKKLLKKYLK